MNRLRSFAGIPSSFNNPAMYTRFCATSTLRWRFVSAASVDSFSSNPDMARAFAREMRAASHYRLLMMILYFFVGGCLWLFSGNFCGQPLLVVGDARSWRRRWSDIASERLLILLQMLEELQLVLVELLDHPVHSNDSQLWL
uniref:Uncharacterized protein n=2 Tax=Anopheles atroparvus TaxID=41427 RepID=A0A182IR76_ANOAO